MVIDISALMSGDIDDVEKDVKALIDVAKPQGVPVKAILKVYYLNDNQVKSAALVAERAGVKFIKTLTGLRLDTTEDIEHKVKLLRSVLKPETATKASGGCYTIDAILTYYKAGARRFGVSATANILDDYSRMLKCETTGLE
ncbi:putative deoxyribose-phosphate aldolase [Seiridium unicorne]|uniref:Deoxyribose-phosphate aldolase n=1 Tax=Seiridium unicorne TaxID=138068 RepID=A0ABR2V8Y2_9PEZI